MNLSCITFLLIYFTCLRHNNGDRTLNSACYFHTTLRNPLKKAFELKTKTKTMKISIDNRIRQPNPSQPNGPPLFMLKPTETQCSITRLL